MRDLESRFNSFEDTDLSWNEKMCYAVAGLVKCNTDTSFDTECAFCDCALSDWTKDDCPYIEHSKRYEKCPMYRLNIRDNRLNSFDDSGIPNDMAISLSEHGFFLFSITKGSYDCFCFRCGFFLDIFNKDMKRKLKLHQNKCTAAQYRISKSYQVFFQKKTLFFLQLISGQYNMAIRKSKQLKVHLSDEQKEEILFLLSLRKSTSPFISVKDVLKETIQIALNRASVEMTKDEEKIKNLLENK